MGKYVELGADDKLPFGKYKDKPLWEIMELDRKYFQWLLDEGIITIDNEAWEWWIKIND